MPVASIETQREGEGVGARPELELSDRRPNMATDASTRPVTSTASAAQIAVPLGTKDVALLSPFASGRKPIFARCSRSPSGSSGECMPLRKPDTLMSPVRKCSHCMPPGANSSNSGMAGYDLTCSCSRRRNLCRWPMDAAHLAEVGAVFEVKGHNGTSARVPSTSFKLESACCLRQEQGVSDVTSNVQGTAALRPQNQHRRVAAAICTLAGSIRRYPLLFPLPRASCTALAIPTQSVYIGHGTSHRPGYCIWFLMRARRRSHPPRLEGSHVTLTFRDAVDDAAGWRQPA